MPVLEKETLFVRWRKGSPMTPPLRSEIFCCSFGSIPLITSAKEALFFFLFRFVCSMDQAEGTEPNWPGKNLKNCLIEVKEHIQGIFHFSSSSSVKGLRASIIMLHCHVSTVAQNGQTKHSSEVL